MIKYLANLIASQIKTDCAACEILKSHIKYLEALVSKSDADRQGERDEARRTVDRLLEISKIRPVGQGPTPSQTGSIPIANIMDIFNEPSEVKD